MKQNIYDNETFFKGYSSLRKSGVTYNDFVEQPAIQSAITDLTKKNILDKGCGISQFAKYCIVLRSRYRHLTKYDYKIKKMFYLNNGSYSMQNYSSNYI